MLDKQLVSAVRFALESRFLPHGVIGTKGGRSRILQWLEVFYKDEGLENGPEERNSAGKLNLLNCSRLKHSGGGGLTSLGLGSL